MLYGVLLMMWVFMMVCMLLGMGVIYVWVAPIVGVISGWGVASDDVLMVGWVFGVGATYAGGCDASGGVVGCCVSCVLYL